MNITAPTLSRVDFAHSFHWSIWFEGFPGPFFPATVLSDASFSFANGDIQHGPGTFNFPQQAGRGALTVQLFELTGWELYQWLLEWRDLIFDRETQTVGLIGHPGVAKKMYRSFDGYARNPVIQDIIEVIPEGDIAYELNSEKSSPVSVSIIVTPVGSLT